MTAITPPPWLEGVRASAVLLAGGRGERVGGKKEHLVVDGRPLLEHALSILDRIGLPVVISLRTDQPAPHGRVVVRDVTTAAGPLGGLLAALEVTTAEWLFVMAVDMPLLVPELCAALFRLRGDHDVVVPRVQGYEHVLASLLHARVAPRLRAIADTGEHGVAHAFAQLDTRYVTASELLADPDLARVDPELSSLTNVNTLDDVARVEALLHRR